ncbi:MAG: C_GCAxxG_C_C family protein [Chloroflexi bacterium]|nr:C_GCAxxG_C_C family protein [Chloroflexota bacterium]
MGKRQREEGSSQELRRQIESYLAEGKQCSQCLLLALKDIIGVHDDVLTTATRTLGRGMGGSGAVCGALTAGILALGLANQRGSEQAGAMDGVPSRYGRSAPPRNDFLDIYAPAEPPEFVQCRELISRFSQEVVPHAGSFNCRDISGIDWSLPNAEELSRYYAPNGAMTQCADLISRTADIVVSLVEGQRPYAA